MTANSIDLLHSLSRNLAEHVYIVERTAERSDKSAGESTRVRERAELRCSRS